MTAGKVACATAEQPEFRGTSNDPFTRAGKNRVFPNVSLLQYHPDI